MTAADMTAADMAAADVAALRQPGATHDAQACAEAWAALTAAHALVTEQLTAALTRTCGLSINEFQILLRADQAPEAGVRMGELCSAVRLTQPSLSRAAGRLEQQGWLQRADAPDDRRGVLVSITPAGRDVAAAMVFQFEQVGMRAHDLDRGCVALEPDAGDEDRRRNPVLNQGRKYPRIGLAAAGVQRERDAAGTGIWLEAQRRLDKRRGMGR